MNALIHFFIFLPILGFVLGLLIPRQKEKWLSQTAFITVGLHMVGAWAFSLYWLFSHHDYINIKELVLVKTVGYEFFIDFLFDKITAVYLLVGSLLTFLVTVYSRYYMHREEGYKRFFNTILFFYSGYTITIFSGNLETLFIGWEVLGISSFLLIAFYRNRYLPVRNGLKVFSIYRIGDVGLLLAMWMSHHLWHENITFVKLNNYELVHHQLMGHSLEGIFISLMILIAAAVKSAQLPFSSWLPRAMEGPTPSSAIFYGSLSVHAGVFLLLRTFPFWEHQYVIRVCIGLLGLTTSVIGSLIARSQSNMKSQIAYSSLSQIGLIFVEVALGWHTLALIHFAGNAFLRTYQLLVSPSVVSYLIREQFYHFIPAKHSMEDSFPKRIEYSLYVLSLKEWNLDAFMLKRLWLPFKRLGRKLGFLNERNLYRYIIPAFALGLTGRLLKNEMPPEVYHAFPIAFSVIAFLLILKSLSERRNPLLAFSLVFMNHLWIALAVSSNEEFSRDQTLIYLSGVLGAFVFGYFLLRELKRREGNLNLNSFQGHVYEHPKLAFFFLIACLSLAGFPISPSFIGADLLFTHIEAGQGILALFVALSMIVQSIALVRLYARLFLGLHTKTYHESAYRSS